MSGNSYTFIKLVKDYSLEIFYSSKNKLRYLSSFIYIISNSLLYISSNLAHINSKEINLYLN